MAEAAAFDLTQFDLTTLGLVGLAAFAASILTGLNGFGGGFVLSIFIAPFVGVQAVVPTMAVVNLIANATRIFAFRERLDRAATIVLLSTAIPGVILGAIVYSHLSPEMIALVLGSFLILAVPLRRVMARLDLRVGPKGLAAAGLGYGLLNGGTMGARMFLVPILLSAGLFGQTQLAVGAVVSVGGALCKIAVFSGLALLTPGLILAGGLIGICTVPGTYIARWIVRRMAVTLHTLFMEVLVVCGGIYFLWRALG